MTQHVLRLVRSRELERLDFTHYLAFHEGFDTAKCPACWRPLTPFPPSERPFIGPKEGGCADYRYPPAAALGFSR